MSDHLLTLHQLLHLGWIMCLAGLLEGLILGVQFLKFLLQEGRFVLERCVLLPGFFEFMLQALVHFKDFIAVLSELLGLLLQPYKI